MIKKVFLDDLPRYKEGKYKGKINWQSSINCVVNFIYGDIKGSIIICNYNKQNKNIDIIYKNKNFSINIIGFSRCQLGNILDINHYTYNYIYNYYYNIGDIVITNTGKIEILEQIRMLYDKNNIKGYKYKCLIDDNIDEISEYALKNGQGCNVCSGHKVLKGVNDLWTTHPRIAKLLKYPEIGYETTYGCNKSEIFICPDCDYEKSYRIYSIVTRGFSCIRCGDGLSYPNKFGFNLLEQLGVDFIPEHNPDWIKPKRYDFYFELKDKKYIVEMDGGIGHGNENTLSNKTAEESKIIDNYKDIKAKEHNIEVIRINCLISNLEYIKNNVLNSQLNNLFDLSKVDWLKCHEFACKSLVKKACELWNNGIKSTLEIAKIMIICRSVAIKYLKQGAKLGWCNYDPKEAQKESGRINSKKNNKLVVQLSLNREYVSEFKSTTEAERQLGISHSSISQCCTNKQKTAGKFKWMYKEDYDEYIKQQNESA